MSFQYRGLKAAKNRHIVTEEEIKEQLEHLISTRPRVTKVTDRAAQNGDEVILDYAGFCDGVQFQGGTAQGQSLVLGSGTFIPGFEEQLVGKSIGEEVSVQVEFPKQYHAENLAGKPAEFRCVIHEIHENSPYKLDDTFAKEVGQCDTMAEMHDKMGRSMQYYADQECEMTLQDQLLDLAAATLDMEVSEEQVNAAIDEHLSEFKAQLAQQSLTLEMYCEFTNTSMEDLRKQTAPEARKHLLRVATIDKIVELEKLEATEEEILQATQRICESNGITVEMLKSMKDPSLDKLVEKEVLASKAMSLIRESAEITE